jgi:hypothetical protein
MAAILALLALFVAIEHHHHSEQSAQTCLLCHFPTSMVGIFIVIVITVLLVLTGVVVSGTPRVGFRQVTRWACINRAPPFLA